MSTKTYSFAEIKTAFANHPSLVAATDCIADLGQCPADKRDALKAALTKWLVSHLVGGQVAEFNAKERTSFEMPAAWSYDFETGQFGTSQTLTAGFTEAGVSTSALKSVSRRIHIAHDKLVVVENGVCRWIIGTPNEDN